MNEQLEELREKRQKKVAGVFKYFSLIMGVFYIMMGLVFYFFPLFEQMSSGMITTISVMLIAYGCFRLYRAVKS